jgi:DNA gyrase/topoisomerase IV subunit A
VKKNLIKFLIIVNILLTTFNTNILAQNKISGEKLKKLLLEKHIIIYNVYAGGEVFELNFNADKYYKSTSDPSYSYTAKQPGGGTWEIFDFEKSIVSLNEHNTRSFKLIFGDDGNIYNLEQKKLYAYRLENKKERIENDARRIEKERIAKELSLKKIEEEKRQLAIKHPEEIKKRDEMRKKTEDDRRQREPVDPRKLVDRQEVYFSDLGIQRNGISHMLCTYGDGSKIKANFIRDHYHNGCPASK